MLSSPRISLNESNKTNSVAFLELTVGACFFFQCNAYRITGHFQPGCPIALRSTGLGLLMCLESWICNCGVAVCWMTGWASLYNKMILSPWIDIGPYFNYLSVWSEAHGAGAGAGCISESTFDRITMGKKWSARQAHGPKSVVPILLMSHGGLLGVTCNKPIRVSSPIPFKSQLLLHYGGFTIYMAEFARAKTEHVSREEARG